MTQNSGVEPIGDEALNGLVGFTPGDWIARDNSVVGGYTVGAGKRDLADLIGRWNNATLMAAAPAMHARILADRTRIAELEAENAGLREGLTECAEACEGSYDATEWPANGRSPCDTAAMTARYLLSNTSEAG